MKYWLKYIHFHIRICIWKCCVENAGHFVSASTYLPLCRGYALVNWISIGSGKGLSPICSKAITWTNAWVWLIGPLRTNFSEIWIEIQNFSFTNISLTILPAKRWSFCPRGDELNTLGVLSFIPKELSFVCHDWACHCAKKVGIETQ